MSKPNIIFLHIDQQNLAAISANGCGHVSTPNMDRLYERGLSFQHSCVANPVCMASRSSWYTGLMSEEHGQLNNNPQFNMDPVTADIGPLVQSGDYDSVYMGKWHIAKPVEKSFDLQFHGHGHGELGDASTVRAAEAFLANRQGNKPFFLNVGLLNPHDCCMWAWEFAPCAATRLSFAPELMEKLPPLPPNHYLPIWSNPKGDPTGGAWTDLDWRYYMYCYYRQVEMVDVEIGRMLDALENSRFADNTLLIFSSDHGDGLAQHYHYGKDCVHDHSVMVPLILLHPSLKKGRRDTAHIVSSIDVTATICDYAGVDPLPGRRGLSLRPLVEGRNTEWRTFAASTTAAARLRMIRTPQYKLINDRQSKEYAFYDLAKDPWEMKNAVADAAHAQEVASLKKYMDDNEATYHYAPQIIKALEKWEKGEPRKTEWQP